jgi:hypothetical protein
MSNFEKFDGLWYLENIAKELSRSELEERLTEFANIIHDLKLKLAEDKPKDLNLPTVVEMHAKADQYALVDDEDCPGAKRIDTYAWSVFVDGAKWMREQAQTK